MLCNYSLPKTGCFFSEGRPGSQKYSHSIKMSHAKIKPLTVFEGKGTSFVLFYHHGCVGYKEALFCRIGSISQGARGAARLTSAAFLCNLYNCFLLFQWVVQRNKGWMCCAPSSRSTPTLGPRQREAVCSGVLLPTARCLLACAAYSQSVPPPRSAGG